jgi:AmmeMemoRadiSam system protein B
MALPALRYLDASPVAHEGKQLICLRDQDGYVEEALVLSPLAFFIATQLDGANDIVDIQSNFVRESGGKMLMSDDIQKVVAFLDEQGFLQTQNFDSIRDKVDRDFFSSDVRPAYFADKSYPGEPNALREFLLNTFMREGGPGEIPKPAIGTGPPLRALVVPHIDFHRGGHTYAHGYLQMAKRSCPELVFIFGVAHAGPPCPFVFTKKHFETPFGTIETDCEIVSRLESVCTFDPYEFETVQRTEHSIEFHAVMLAYLFGNKTKIVPILCGPTIDERGAVHPADAPHVVALLDECRRIVEEKNCETTVIASADFAHVGRRFGDSFDIDDTILDSVRKRDDEDLQQLVERDPRAWYDSVMKDENARRVCGINCIYSALRSTEGLAQNAERLSYGYAPDPAGGIVSFASVSIA